MIGTGILCAKTINTDTADNYEGTHNSIQFAFCQAEGSYDQYHNIIHAIACDVLQGLTKHINPCDQQFEIMTLLKVVQDLLTSS